MAQKPQKYTFSGHDSFQCRLLWLKKGYDFLNTNHSFNEDGAVISLGVGSNMVRSIRYWMRAFGLTNENDVLSELAHLIFGGQNGEEPLDPFLEDETTLWLLHYHLVKTMYASTYHIIFSELRKIKIEFTKEDFLSFVKIKSNELSFNVSENSVSDDFGVFTKMYLRGDGSKDREDSFSGILTELNLLNYFVRVKEDTQKRESVNVYYLEPTDRDEIPEELILYCLLENKEFGDSISINTLEIDANSPSTIFAMTRAGLFNKIKALTAKFPFIVYTEQAGIRELQFRQKPNPLEILKQYYASQFQSIG
ncbi:DUF4007 family protein [Emticicia sediminis]